MPSIHTVGDALLQLIQEVFLFIPKLVGALLWLLVGYIVARVVATLLTKGLRLVHIDRVADRAGAARMLQAAGTRMDAAALLAAVAFWWIFLILGVDNAVNALGMTQVINFVNQILGYIPNIFAAMLILLVGALIANVVADVVRGAATGAGMATAGLLSNVARWGILLFAALSALTQLNIAQNMIFILFAGIVAMLALAGGLAFGLGGVDSARSLLASQSMGGMLQPGQSVRIGQQQGTVVRHDLNTTVLDTEGGQISIPNATLMKEQVTLVGNGRQ